MIDALTWIISFIAGAFAMGAVWLYTDYLSRESLFRKGYRATMFMYSLKHKEDKSDGNDN